jgi:hypothetical protein
VTPLWADGDADSHSAPTLAEGAAPQPQTQNHQTQQASYTFQWRPEAGLRFGTVGAKFQDTIFIKAPNITLSYFLENRLSEHLAIRPSLEFVYYRERGMMNDGSGEAKKGTTTINRIGLVADCLYYFKGNKPITSGYYLLAGLGLYRTTLYEWEWSWGRIEKETSFAPAIAGGVGRTGNSFGLEIKAAYSPIKSDVFQDVAEKWVQLALFYRFNLLKQPQKHPHWAVVQTQPLLVTYSDTQTIAQQPTQPVPVEVDAGSIDPPIATEAAPQPQPQSLQIQPSGIQWKPKIGIRIGIATWGGALSFFLENQLNKHFAIRPGVEFSRYEENWIGDGGRIWEDRDLTRVTHKGLVVDCLYYFRGKRPIARGHYLFAGFGIYNTKLESKDNPFSESHSFVPSVAYGYGMAGKNIGFEIKFIHSAISPDPIHFKNTGNEWGQVGLSYRFNLSGEH